MNKNIPLIFFVFFTVLNAIFSQEKIDNYTLIQLDSILENFKKEKAYNKLLPYAEAGVKKAEKELGNQDTTYAKMLYFLGFAYQMQQDFEKGEAFLKQAIAIQENKIPQHKNHAASLHNLAFLYHNIGRYTDAEIFYSKALKIRKKALGAKHPDYASSLNNLAGVYWYLHKFDKVLPLYQEAILIRKEVLGEKSPDYISSLNNLAVLYVELNRYTEAENLYKQVIELRKEILGKDDPSYASGLHNLGILYSDMERYEEAEHLYNEALALERQNQRILEPSYVENLLTISSFYSDINLELADSLCREAVAISKKIFGEHHIYYAKSLNNMAVIRSRKKDYKVSEQIYKDLITIYKKHLGIDNQNYASILNNLGYLYWENKQYEQALPLYKEALEISKSKLNGRNELYLMVLNNLAALYKNIGNYEEAFNVIRLSVIVNSGIELVGEIDKNITSKILEANFVSFRQILTSLDNYYTMLYFVEVSQRKEKQIIISDLALQLLQKNRTSFINESDKLRNLEKNSSWVILSLHALDKKSQAERAFDIAEQGKSVLLLEASKTNYAYSFGDLPDSLVQKERALQENYGIVYAALAGTIALEEKEQYYGELNKINQEIKNFKKQIEKSYPKYASLKYQPTEAKVKDIQQLLEPETALLEYVIGDSIVYIFYVDKENLRWVEFIIDKKKFTDKIQNLHNVLSNYAFISKKESVAYTQYTENAHWFYKNLIAPVINSTSKNIKSLMIVTDGELGHLPFEAFLVEPAPQTKADYAKLHYLVKDYKISYNYSATLWKENKMTVRPVNNQSLLAMAANYEPVDGQTSSLRKHLQPLPEARKEVEALSKIFEGFFTFEEQSSERNFREKSSNYAIIHLAMHGLLNNKTPILSGLAFTDSKDSTNDNFLQAYEISKMKFNADLVVLSACETGYGKFEKGNGIASLARAFMYAGASSLVVSLWQVNDYSTAEIMKLFYENLAKGMTKDEALQQAKWRYLENAKEIAAHPAFWSPFVLIGDSRPVEIHFANSNWKWIGLGAFALILITIILFKKKN